MNRHLLKLVVLFTTMAFGQTDRSFSKTAPLQNMNYYQLKQAVELVEQQERIAALQKELEVAQSKAAAERDLIKHAQEENEALRLLMQYYIEQIDAENGVQNENTSTRDPSEIEQFQKIEKLAAKIRETKKLGNASPADLETMENEFMQEVLKLKALNEEKMVNQN